MPVLAEALAVDALPFPNNPNSLCVPVASVAAKKVATFATAPEKDVLDATFRAVSVPSCVSHAAGAVVFVPMATYRLSPISVVLSPAICAANAVFATVGMRL